VGRWTLKFVFACCGAAAVLRAQSSRACVKGRAVCQVCRCEGARVSLAFPLLIKCSCGAADGGQSRKSVEMKQRTSGREKTSGRGNLIVDHQDDLKLRELNVG
jgi:hypothetical protein